MNPTVQRLGAGPLEGLDDLGRVFLPKHAGLVVSAQVEPGELFQLEAEQVERVLDQAAFDELLGHNPAEGLDVERPALREVLDAARELRRAARHILAAPGDLLGLAIGDLLPGNRPATGGAFAPDVSDEIERLGDLGPFRFHDLDDLGDYHAGLADHDDVADTDVFASDFIFIVEGGARDGGALHEDRFKLGNGRQHACAPDLYSDRLQHGFGGRDPRNGLVDDGVSWRAGLRRDARPIGEVVH